MAILNARIKIYVLGILKDSRIILVLEKISEFNILQIIKFNKENLVVTFKGVYMKIKPKEFCKNERSYIIRSSEEMDARQLSIIRPQIDGETENLDREKGEGFIDENGFIERIKSDTYNEKNLFLVVVIDEKIVGFSRCEGSDLKRFAHKVEFGICILKDYWGYGIGKNLLKETTEWADSNNIRKITLNVVETNNKAIKLYEEFGFEIEGILKIDRLLSDGKFYNTLVMGRIKE